MPKGVPLETGTKSGGGGLTEREYNRRYFQRQSELIDAAIGNPPKTQAEKDLFNLKYMLCNIKHGSRYYRWGHVSTLQRAIKRLEASIKEAKRKHG
jgi:hypothetical protein